MELPVIKVENDQAGRQALIYPPGLPVGGVLGILKPRAQGQ
jgi:hypothetical protein